jgi:hypothetical protein
LVWVPVGSDGGDNNVPITTNAPIRTNIAKHPLPSSLLIVPPSCSALEKRTPPSYVNGSKHLRGTITVTKYDELYGQFAAWNAALTQYEQHAELVMLNFYSGFRHYLGLGPTSDDRITLHRIDPTLDRPHKHIKVDHFANALCQDGDGSWRFGITVTVKDPNPSPLSSFVTVYFDILFTLRDVECEFQNADDRTRRFPCKCELGNENFPLHLQGTLDAYEYLVSVLESLFHLEPWKRPEKIPIGFDVSGHPKEDEP